MPSQYNEDTILAELFGDHAGRFLDLGAFDGFHGSNTFALAEKGWTGVCVEADPWVFPRLVEAHANHPEVKCLCAAISDVPGVVEISRLRDQCSCHEPQPAVLAACPVRTRFHAATVDPMAIRWAFGGQFDLISLDIEGMDLTVLRSLAALTSHTKALILEDAMPCTAFDPEYYGKLISAAAALGFTKTLARTGPEAPNSGNSILVR